MGGQATRGERPGWLGANEWAGRRDVPSRVADIAALFAARWWCIPGPDLPQPPLNEVALAWWTAHQRARRN